MQLCRFVLREDPETVRSGIYHENRLFETDGEKPIGVHELSKIVLLAPIQHAPSLRVFDESLNYTSRNSAVFGGPLTEFDAPPGTLGVEVRVAAILKDSGERVSVEEAADFILGYTLFLGLIAEDRMNPILAADFPFAVGPFLNIPEAAPAELFKKPIQVKVNGEVIAEVAYPLPDFESMIECATETNRVLVADLIAGPRLPLPPMPSTPLGRGLQPGDNVQVVQENLGILTVKVL